jgi:hypothetical protein
MRKSISALLLISIAFTACIKSKSNKPAIIKPDTAQLAIWPTNADVYFVGTITGSYPQNDAVATIWKNGVPTELPNNLSASGLTPNAIAVKNNDVYVVGKAAIGSWFKAIYWKNGITARLISNSTASEANAIALNGNDVYIAGMTDNKACLWKNGVATTIASDPSEALAITVSGNDVYVAGIIYGYNPSVAAALWKNGVRVALRYDNPSMGSTANAVTTDGNDVYVAGSEIGKGATVWKNGEPMILPAGSLSSTSREATDITIKGNDVYAAGYINNKVTIWKNGVATILPFNDNNSIISKISISINGNNFYVTGGFDNSGATNAIFWQNNVAYQFSKKLCVISGLAIVPH